jgi:hypothetical protein
MCHPLFKIFGLIIKLSLGSGERAAAVDWGGNFNANLTLDFSIPQFLFPILLQ